MSETTPFSKAKLVSSLSPKIREEHLEREAAVYVRQSTSHQLREHQESTARQYALKDRLIAGGWPEQQVMVIDDDLGVSGNGKADRQGFQLLLKYITDQRVGIVLGLEMSRLARNSKDWSDLFEVCAIFNTLIADEDGVFDPQDPNDRLVLGLKGIISELEQHTMKVRLERGRLSKARRGELFHDVPAGYVLDEQGQPQLDPDASARHAIKLFFDRFELLGSSHALFRYLAEHNIKMPFRARSRDAAGTIDWRVPGKETVYGWLKHPLYAGTYGYGRKRKYSKNQPNRPSGKYLPPEQWKVFIKDRHPAYITWEQYERHQQRLVENDTRSGQQRGPARDGSALLTGIVFCAHCQRKLSPDYSANSPATYSCSRHLTMAYVEPCHSRISCDTLDEFVSAKLLQALGPAGVDLSLQVIEDEVARRTQLDTLHAQRVEHAAYVANMAEKRYKAVDASNRLVAMTLEQEWETALSELQLASQQLEQLRNTRPVQLSESERQELRQTCADIDLLWRSQATVAQRKQITRLLLQRVEVDVQDNSERVVVRLHWSSSFQSCDEIRRDVARFDQLTSYEALLERALELSLSGQSFPKMADTIEAEGFRSPRTGGRISPAMLQKLLAIPRCQQKLKDPHLDTDHWRSADLAQQLGIPEKRLKDWVTRGWVTAVQRPHGGVWVIYADQDEYSRLQHLVKRQTGQGRPGPPKKLRTPAPIPRKNS